jgi:hypothetical protein
MLTTQSRGVMVLSSLGRSSEGRNSAHLYPVPLITTSR